VVEVRFEGIAYFGKLLFRYSRDFRFGKFLALSSII
jgi:hypothetical protein